jgi:membrane associated rhomboid family serine protease
MGIYDRSYYREDNELDLRPSWNQRSAVSTLIIINVAVFLANVFLSKDFVVGYQGAVNEFLMLRGGDATKPLMWWHTLTYGFCHDAFGFMHLAMNMLGLYFLGRTVEERYGRLEFYRIYLITVVVCGAVWLLKEYAFKSNGSMLGASGAVMCISMLFVFNYPTARVTLFVFPVPAWVLGVILVLTNIVSSPTSSIATDVHLTGVLCAAAYFYFGLSFRFLGDLQGTWRRQWRKVTGPKLKIHNVETGAPSSEADEADRILAKIHESGQDSLSSKERKFLEKYSRAVRERKEQL